MEKRPIIIALCIPVFLFWTAAIFFTFIGHGELYSFLVLICFALCFILGLLLSLLFLLLYFTGKKKPAMKKQCILSFMVTLSILVALVSYPLTSTATWNLKKPARAQVAQRIIAIAKKEHYTSGSQVYLRQGEYYLSDNGPAYYYTDGNTSAVMFTDASGILTGSGTLYVSDPHAKPPENDLTGLEHKSGHWWTGIE